jgi:hypothetical protein
MTTILPTFSCLHKVPTDTAFRVTGPNEFGVLVRPLALRTAHMGASGHDLPAAHSCCSSHPSSRAEIRTHSRAERAVEAC